MFQKRIILWMFLLSFVFRAVVCAAHQSLLQRGIAEEVLRFHVLANSDSEKDQQIKYLVRDEVLDWLERAMEETEENAQGKESPQEENGAKAAECDLASGRQQTLDFLSSHLEELEQTACRALQRAGASYGASAAVEHCWFPERTYGDCTFPAGYYEALRLKLGKAEGKNWWCVLYPRLCFLDCVHAVAEEDQAETLKEALTAEEYESLLKKPSGWRIAFRWF